MWSFGVRRSLVTGVYAVLLSRGLCRKQKSSVLLWENNRMFGKRAGSNSGGMVAPKEEVVRFIAECMRVAGTMPDDANIVAHHLMTADYRGHFSHGMNRMQMYVHDIQHRITDPTAKPQLLSDFQAIALVDGKNALGQVVGKYCMELAISKARNFGIGMVAARGSNHYGIAGYYALMAMQEDMIGFSCTNTSPLMAPTRSKRAGLGTNPLSLGMAASNDDQFVLDMATTAVALGKIELAIRKNEQIPRGWALNAEGKETENAEVAYEASLLMPLGGDERSSGYKGYGLALMIEVLCGILSGSDFGPNIRPWKTGNRIANLGQSFLAINPEAFTAGSKDRLSALLKELRSLPVSGNKPVLIPGDPETRAMEKVDKEGGITYHENQLKAMEEFAKQMGVAPIKLVPVKA